MGGVVNLKTSIEVFRKHRTKVSAVMKVSEHKNEPSR